MLRIHSSLPAPNRRPPSRSNGTIRVENTPYYPSNLGSAIGDRTNTQEPTRAESSLRRNLGQTEERFIYSNNSR